LPGAKLSAAQSFPNRRRALPFGRPDSPAPAISARHWRLNNGGRPGARHVSLAGSFLPNERITIPGEQKGMGRAQPLSAERRA